MCHLETYMEYLKGVCVPTHTVFVNTPKLWVCPHPYLFHRGLNKAWVWSHPQCTACKETVLPRDKVWVTPHPGQTACKVFSPTVWVCSHPRRTARHSTTLLFIYFKLFFICEQKQTIFRENICDYPSLRKSWSFMEVRWKLSELWRCTWGHGRFLTAPRRSAKAVSPFCLSVLIYSQSRGLEREW